MARLICGLKRTSCQKHKKHYISPFFHFPFVPQYFAFSAMQISKEEAIIAEDVHGQARE